MLTTTEFDLLLQPVKIRLACAQKLDRFRDRAAQAIVDRFGIERDLQGIPRTILTSALRQTQCIDQYVNTFLEAFPTGQGIEIDGGLSTRFHRLSETLDWPRFSWQLVINPVAHGYLNTLYPQLDNFRLQSDMKPLDCWFNYINSQKPKALVVVAGEHTALTPKQVNTLISEAYEVFADAKLQRLELLLCHSGASPTKLYRQNPALRRVASYRSASRSQPRTGRLHLLSYFQTVFKRVTYAEHFISHLVLDISKGKDIL